MNTKLKGDIAEQAVTLRALKQGWGVLRPIGDRLPYDLVFDIGGRLLKVQVKSAWFDTARGNWVVDNRRTKTNRRHMVRSRYCVNDFDFAIAYLDEIDLMYVFPVDVFISYGSEIHLIETNKRQRKPRSAAYREAWMLMAHWAALEETPLCSLAKLGEAGSAVIPSQA
ncbi:group I intron-associated PD-(D/E)XK endonuclease [Hymenobacter weizhouensis]|uniref:group I intron-associated PD-(D/E)XK endonuclease n=1 Tax=Hymenobacter sp. YIM 151500-1 TaxID=2987689 RepID=UPI002225E871|nr:group I intron-associated PD-(D/E)XK endonuclease [Hymenobacter sp. YIM 151500-1]UYZ62307.1 group I intron-associated PD-(D/E)XK endonuclease [Hymenobacter sp. YIM 151500-1]